MKYDELVKALRYCRLNPSLPCDGCVMFDKKYSIDTLHTDAAAAIEELDAEETRLLLLTSELQDKLMDAQAEVERLKADVDAAYAH